MFVFTLLTLKCKLLYISETWQQLSTTPHDCWTFGGRRKKKKKSPKSVWTFFLIALDSRNKIAPIHILKKAQNNRTPNLWSWRHGDLTAQKTEEIKSWVSSRDEELPRSCLLSIQHHIYSTKEEAKESDPAKDCKDMKASFWTLT